MDNIIEPTMDYDFSKLYLGPPSTLAGGAYFTRLMYNTNKPLFIQTPKSLTKQGFIKSGKKAYADLMFDNNDTVFINWIENLETKCQELIFSKGQHWFETKMEKEDIESAFTTPFKIFKSGKFYLLRVNIKQNIKIYNECEQIFKIEDITADKMLLSILEIQGIKFTSRNFQIEIELKQSMIVSPDPFLDECFIKKPPKNTVHDVAKDTIIKEDNIHLDLDEFIDESAKELVKNINKSRSLEDSNITNESIDLDIYVKEPKNDPQYELEEVSVVLEPELEPNPKLEKKFELIKEDSTILEEVDLSLGNNLEPITLKKPNQVYYDIYKKARDKAIEAKKSAIIAYIEMNNIKKTYMIDDIDNSDTTFDDFYRI